jgi:hypothetical protein
MIAAGGNIYYLAKLAGIFGLNVQDVGSMQTGVSVRTFQAMLMAQGEGQSYEEAHDAMIEKERSMAEIVGAYFTSHVPAIGGPSLRGCNRNLLEAVLRRLSKVHEWLAQVKPDVAIVFNNDHGLNFFTGQDAHFCRGRGGGISQCR